MTTDDMSVKTSLAASPPKKKRGPKKKVWSPQMRQMRQQVRRSRANARERQRMHGLNDSLERLRSVCPMFANQRLSKIDTLRFARNYIEALAKILQAGEVPDNLEYARILTKDLSQGTVNLIAGHLQVSPHLLWFNCSDNLYYPDNQFANFLPFPFSAHQATMASNNCNLLPSDSHSFAPPADPVIGQQMHYPVHPFIPPRLANNSENFSPNAGFGIYYGDE